MMGKTRQILMRLMLVTALGIVLSLFNKADVEAVTGYTLTVAVDGNGGGTFDVTINAEAPVSSSPYDVEAGASISIVANPAANYRFGNWTIESETDINISGATDSSSISFTMPAKSVNITAHFVEDETEHTPTTVSDTGPTSTPNPPEEEGTNPDQTMKYFLDGVKSQVKDKLRQMQSVANNPTALAGLKKNGLTIEAGNWISFDFATCSALDELIKRGVPVTIKYIYNGEPKEIFIPANYKYTLKEMVDYTGYVGFEFIRAVCSNGVFPPKATSALTETSAEFMTLSRYDDDAMKAFLTDISLTPENAAATIAAEKAAKQQAASAQLAEIQTLLSAKTSDREVNARSAVDLDMTNIDILDPATVSLLLQNSRFAYNVKISVSGGLTTTIMIPANFNFRPFIKADGTMNIHEVLWWIISKKK